MKYLVFSDIHGSSLSLKTVLETFDGRYDFIIICGDYLNHGPRNPLPEGWNPKETAALLNSVKGKIICVRGNCDSEVDEMILEFPCLSSYANIMDSGKRIFIHHGHLYDRKKIENWLSKNTVVISGHTHQCVLEKSDDLVFFNPGSISLPKDENGKTCGLIEISSDMHTSISLYSIEGKLIRTLEC